MDYVRTHTQRKQTDEHRDFIVVDYILFEFILGFAPFVSDWLCVRTSLSV